MSSCVRSISSNTVHNADEHMTNAPIFLKPWFLKALVGENVEIAEYKNGEVQAFWPMQRRKAAGLTILQSPDLVPYTGPWFQYPNDMGEQKRAREFRKGISALLKAFPNHHALFGRMSPIVTDFLPFHWEGASVTPRVTYRIPDNLSLAEVESKMKASNARNLKKAEKLMIREESNTSVLWELSQKTFGRQDKEPHFSSAQLKEVHRACSDRGLCKLLSAGDAEGNPHSAALFLRDNHNVYYYVGGSDPAYRNSEAFSLIIWEGIKWSRELGLSFDFEGSMQEPIARFFRSWGAEQCVFYQIELYKSGFAKFLFQLKRSITGQ